MRSARRRRASWRSSKSTPRAVRKPLALPNNLVPRVPFTPGTAKLRFANDSGLNAYYAVTETGFDRQVPKAEVRDGMEVLREFVDSAGKPVTSITVGDEVTVRLKFRAVGRRVCGTWRWST